MLIGLTGRKQAGKDTVFERARHLMADVLPVERASFADLLYESAAASLGVFVDDLRRWKNDPEVFVTVGLANCTTYRRQSLRQYLQRYGTEAHRSVFGDDFWVDNVRLDHAGKLVFVTDVRFDNEAQAVRRAGGIVVRVVGPEEIEHAPDGHASEAGLSAGTVDLTLRNGRRDDGFRSLDVALAAFIRSSLQTGWAA